MSNHAVTRNRNIQYLVNIRLARRARRFRSISAFHNTEGSKAPWWFHTAKTGFRTENKLSEMVPEEGKLISEQKTKLSEMVPYRKNWFQIRKQNWSEMVPCRKNWCQNREQIVWDGSRIGKLVSEQKTKLVWDGSSTEKIGFRKEKKLSKMIPEQEKLV